MANSQPPVGFELKTEDTNKPKKSRGKNKRKRFKSKPSKWADKCMYAELLEMKEQPNFWVDDAMEADDGLPSDLEQAWVAVAPVPVGKRCLAITHQSAAGVIGICESIYCLLRDNDSQHCRTAPNTTLRSRLLGKMLLPRFPSSLPPLTILDCILDANWTANGIVHVLDVVKWKGQDVADCEAPFRFVFDQHRGYHFVTSRRFWWRDTRLAELPKFSPPSSVFHFSLTGEQGESQSAQHSGSYKFPYPTSFIPIPYHTDTTFQTMDSSIIPMARSSREIPVEIPASAPFQPSSPTAMPIDSSHGPLESRISKTVTSQVSSDGLLLYVSQASYEEGTSPLSCWVPIKPVTEPGDQQPKMISSPLSPLDVFQRCVSVILRLLSVPFSLQACTTPNIQNRRRRALCGWRQYGYVNHVRLQCASSLPPVQWFIVAQSSYLHDLRLCYFLIERGFERGGEI